MKKLIGILVMTSFFTSIFSFSKGQNKGVFPVEQFSVLEAKLSNGKPVVGSFNLANKDYNKKKQYPWCLTINIALELKNVGKNGLPINAESHLANKLEDDLINSIRKNATVHYIGHLFNDSFLDVYAYLNSPEKAHQFLQQEVNKKGLIRGFAYEIKQDPNWNEVKPFLK